MARESFPSGKSTDASQGRKPVVDLLSFNHKAFLSYNQRADGALAKALETGLEQFSKKWYQRRAFDVFRDATSLGANAGLWQTLQDSLIKSEFYILLASPESAASPWVSEELRYWLDNRGCAKILIVLTSGQMEWAKGQEDFDWTKTTALNREVLGDKFSEEPLWVDFSWARGLDEQAIKRHKRFADQIATLASPLHGRSKSDLFGEDLRQHRRQIRLAQVAVATLVVLLMDWPLSDTLTRASLWPWPSAPTASGSPLDTGEVAEEAA